MELSKEKIVGYILGILGFGFFVFFVLLSYGRFFWGKECLDKRVIVGRYNDKFKCGRLIEKW